jgi:hypothetical protein
MLNDKHRGKVAAWRREQRKRAQRRAEKHLHIQAGVYTPLFRRVERLEDGKHIDLDTRWKRDVEIKFQAMRRADHFTECSCTHCGNPRRKWKGRKSATLTRQELAVEERQKQEEEETNEDNDLW